MTKSKIFVRIALVLVCLQFVMLLLPTVGIKSESYYGYSSGVLDSMYGFSQTINSFFGEPFDGDAFVDYFKALIYWWSFAFSICIAVAGAVMAPCFKRSFVQMIALGLASLNLVSLTNSTFVVIWTEYLEGSSGYTVTMLPEAWLNILLTVAVLVLVPVVITMEKKERLAAVPAEAEVAAE